MNKTLAKILSAIISIGLFVVIQYGVRANIHADSETMSIICLLIASLCAIILTMFIEGKEKEPSIQNIAMAGIFSIFGVWIAVYTMLLDEVKS